MTSSGWRMAVGTFTAIPVRPPSQVDARTGRSAIVLAPLAVTPVALLVAGLGAAGLALHVPALAVAALVIGVVALSSRGLHLDGLADTADGLAASYQRERALEIMRRGNTGPAGVSCLVIVLLIQIASAATVLARPWGPLIVGLAICLSRAALLVVCVRGVSAARTSGLGAVVAGVIPPFVVAALAASACGLLALVFGVVGMPWWQGGLAVTFGLLIAAALTVRCVRRFGGVTGDVMGASIELALAAILLVAAAG